MITTTILRLFLALPPTSGCHFIRAAQGHSFIINKNIITYQGIKSSIEHDLIGTWVLSSTSHTQVRRISKNKTEEMTLSGVCNVCPKFSFKINNTGQSEVSGNAINLFKWRILTSNLIISGVGKSKLNSSALSNGIYKIRFSTSTQGELTLELTDKQETIMFLTKLN